MGKDIFNFLSDFPFHLVWVIRSKEGFGAANEIWNRKLNRRQRQKLSKDSIVTTFNNEVILTRDLALLANCDLIIESITEDLETKSGLFNELDHVAKPDIIFASNTSSIRISSLVPSERRIDRLIGMHFFYPLKIKNLVEVNLLPETSRDTIDSVSEFLQFAGRYHIFLRQSDHFLINRLILPLQAGVYNLHEENGIPFQLLDKIVKENFIPAGIFEFFDQVGIDIMYVAINNYTKLKEDFDFYQPLIGKLKKMIEEGHLGVKKGQGFYPYPKNQSSAMPSIDSATKKLITDKMYKWYLEPVYEVIAKGILTPQEINFIYSEYLGIDYSPLDLAVKMGFNVK